MEYLLFFMGSEILGSRFLMELSDSHIFIHFFYHNLKQKQKIYICINILPFDMSLNISETFILFEEKTLVKGFKTNGNSFQYCRPKAAVSAKRQIKMH